jgi:hypothetical protein
LRIKQSPIIAWEVKAVNVTLVSAVSRKTVSVCIGVKLIAVAEERVSTVRPSKAYNLWGPVGEIAHTSLIYSIATFDGTSFEEGIITVIALEGGEACTASAITENVRNAMIRHMKLKNPVVFIL